MFDKSHDKSSIGYSHLSVVLKILILYSKILIVALHPLAFVFLSVHSVT